MTQDAPLDQKALEAVAQIIWTDFAARYSGGNFPGLDSKLIAAQQIVATSKAILAALSRRVPASGGEAERADELWESLLPYMQVASHASGAHNAYDDKVKALDLIRAALSPIVAAPEGWRRAFLAYVEPEDAFTQLAIALCRADGNNPDATVSIDGGPMRRHWHYYAEEARTMLLAPEGKAEPVAAVEALRRVIEEGEKIGPAPTHDTYGDRRRLMLGVAKMLHEARAALSTPVKP